MGNKFITAFVLSIGNGNIISFDKMEPFLF